MRSIKRFGVACAFLACGSVSWASVIDATPTLLYHLDAANSATITKDGSNNVTAWNDANGSGNNFSQVTGATVPVYNATVPSVFNNNPALLFNGAHGTGAGTTDTAASRLELTTSTTVKTFFIVCDTVTSNGNDGVWGQYAADTGLRRGNGVWASNQTTPYNGAGNNNDYSTSLLINGFATNVAPTGTPVIVTAFGNSTFSATGLGDYFLVGGNGSRAWNGYVAEVAAYSGTLTTAQEQAIESSLGAKYGITVAPEPASLSLFALGGMGLLARRRRSA